MRASVNAGALLTCLSGKGLSTPLGDGSASNVATLLEDFDGHDQFKAPHFDMHSPTPDIVVRNLVNEGGQSSDRHKRLLLKTPSRPTIEPRATTLINTVNALNLCPNSGHLA